MYFLQKAHLLNLPKQYPQLRTKNSKVLDYGGQLSFKLPQ